MPKSKNVGTQCPTKVESWCLSVALRRSESRMEPSAAHRNRSEGSLAVCCSKLRAIGPSACNSGFVITTAFAQEVLRGSGSFQIADKCLRLSVRDTLYVGPV